MTISEYILENDISFASCDDIEISKCFAEMTVLSSLVEAYSKYETICEYTTTNPAEFNIIMESATEAIDAKFTEVKDEDVKSNAKSTKEKWYKSIWAWIKKTVKAIMNYFTRIDTKKLIKMLTKLEEKQPNGTIDFPVGKAHDVGQLLDIYGEFVDAVDGEDSATEADIFIIYDKVEALNASDKESTKMKFSAVIVKIRSLDENVIPKCKEIIQNVEEVERMYPSVIDLEYMTSIKKTATAMSKLYTTNMNAFLEAQTRIIKEYKKSYSK